MIEKCYSYELFESNLLKLVWKTSSLAGLRAALDSLTLKVSATDSVLKFIHFLAFGMIFSHS